jgi:integrase
MAKAFSKEVLTDAKAAKAAPGLHWDSHPKAPPMFGLRVTAAGSRAWFLNYLTHDSTERRITIGRFPTWKVGAAREKAAELRRIVDEGGDPLADKQDRQRALSVADLVARYIAEVLPKKRPATQEQYKYVLTKVVVPAFGTKKAVNLTRDDVEGLCARFTAKGQFRRANTTGDIVRLLYTQAAKWKLCAAHENPASRLDRNPEPGRDRFLTKGEFARLDPVLYRWESAQPDVVAAIRLLLLTGARRGEVVGARYSQFDLDTLDEDGNFVGTWKKPAATTKTKKDQWTPLSLETVALVRRQREARGNIVQLHDDRVFPGLKVGRLSYQWQRIRKDAGLEDVRIHDLRHSYASFLASSKLSLPIIGALLGHTQARTTQRYAHLLDEPLREATGIVGKLVGAGQ